jgi:hypothetical protein
VFSRIRGCAFTKFDVENSVRFRTNDPSELRRPLGVAIVGGLLVSQSLTLCTTPIIYLYLDRLSHWLARRAARRVIRRP